MRFGVQQANYRQNNEISETLESPVFSRVFFNLKFSKIVVKSAEF